MYIGFPNRSLDGPLALLAYPLAKMSISFPKSRLDSPLVRLYRRLVIPPAKTVYTVQTMLLKYVFI
jgi:hypothetical protein